MQAKIGKGKVAFRVDGSAKPVEIERKQALVQQLAGHGPANVRREELWVPPRRVGNGDPLPCDFGVELAQERAGGHEGPGRVDFYLSSSAVGDELLDLGEADAGINPDHDLFQQGFRGYGFFVASADFIDP